MKRRAVYAGSFDPPTNGHAWVIGEASNLFDLTVALAHNPEKRTRFDIDSRQDMVMSLIPPLTRDGSLRIAKIGNRFLVDWALERGFEVLIRGIRNTRDFEYEAAMSSINGDISPKISTVFLVPPRGLREISSSMVMGLVGIEGWETVVSQYVPASVLDALKGLRK